MDDFYAGIVEVLFEQGKSGFEAEVERNDDDDHDNDDDIRALLPGDLPHEEVPEEEELDVNRDVDAQEDEVLTDKLLRKQRFMSTDAACDNDSFHAVPEQPQETFKWKN